MRKEGSRGAEGQRGSGEKVDIYPPPNAQSPTPDTEFIEIGKIVAPQGLKGELRIYPDSDFPERFLQPGTRWLLRPGQKEPQSIELIGGRCLDGKGMYVIQLAGVDDRTQAEALRGATLLVPAGDRPPLEEDEFHVLDLIGLEVFDQATQTLIGKVVQMFSAGNDLLEVERSPVPNASEKKPKTVLIPFVKAIVPVVDLAQRRIEITPPPGLIES